MYCLAKFQMVTSTIELTSLQSSTCTIQPIPPSSIKIEHGTEPIIILSDNLDGNSLVLDPPNRFLLHNSILLDSLEKTPTLKSHLSPHLGCHQSISVANCLKKLWASKGSRIIFRSLNYGIFDMQRVKFFPTVFNSNVVFELPKVEKVVLHFHRKLMHKMDK